MILKPINHKHVKLSYIQRRINARLSFSHSLSLPSFKILSYQAPHFDNWQRKGIIFFLLFLSALIYSKFQLYRCILRLIILTNPLDQRHREKNPYFHKYIKSYLLLHFKIEFIVDLSSKSTCLSYISRVISLYRVDSVLFLINQRTV